MNRSRDVQLETSPERHFRTEDVRENLKTYTVSSSAVALVAQVILLALNMGATMALARLLVPRDFGLVAMVMTVMAFLRIFKDAGLSTATGQHEGVNHAQVSNLFWANVVVSAFASLVMVVSAPLVAGFYGEPELTGITLALAVTFVLSGLSAQHLAVLNRQMRFKAIAAIQIGSTTAGVVTGVGMAWWQYGHWSLVGAQLSTVVVSSLLTWNASRWRPQWFSRTTDTRPLLVFGANMTVSAFLYSVARGADGLFIGKYYGSDLLGVYSRASALLVRPMEQLTTPLNDVFVPALS